MKILFSTNISERSLRFSNVPSVCVSQVTDTSALTSILNVVVTYMQAVRVQFINGDSCPCSKGFPILLQRLQ